MHKMRLLCAFQALEIMTKHGCKKAYGVNATTARRIVFEITGIKMKRGQKVAGRTLAEYFDSIGYVMNEGVRDG